MNSTYQEIEHDYWGSRSMHSKTQAKGYFFKSVEQYADHLDKKRFMHMHVDIKKSLVGDYQG